ncbi:hypothetical protein CAPTEDRAFT_206926 [Capitella teleta]|uniref:Uncharacterized protein n=1 Tax=Capitella teleta TaxID=283909 RepID=R7UU67_CAPTE|nr:hypothetical protein CAPTEDRAFT_206926 [Capitella teleta]|eukprot:ELU09735.1 hypothetical protein CAPTEDRAFT_206926 [Capitella teleta]
MSDKGERNRKNPSACCPFLGHNNRSDLRARQCYLAHEWNGHLRSMRPGACDVLSERDKLLQKWCPDSSEAQTARMRLPLHLKMPLDADAALSSSSVGNWLGQELELRGIDSVVYTRYILSILLQDDFHLDLRDPDFFPPSKKAAKHTEEHRSSKCRIRRFDLKSKLNEADSEMMKKSAAVECLKSVTDEIIWYTVSPDAPEHLPFGIEPLLGADSLIVDL